VPRHATIVIVDDEIDLAEAYGEYLSDLGYEVELATSATGLYAIVGRTAIDLVILDLNMPGEGGLDVLRRLRAEGIAPVLILTAIPEPIERVVGLELGADDFVVKPVEPQELAARVAALLRRYGRAGRDVIVFEQATVDLTASRLLRSGHRPERLTAGEITLLRTFASRPNQVLSRDELIRLAPAEDREPFDRSIDSRIARLRQKLATRAILTVRGQGYMFVPPEPTAI
jgi:DNA-binding response OmpR family regulator